MTLFIGILIVLAIVILCAVFRVNIWSLLPWVPMTPCRLDDRIETLRGGEHNGRDKDKNSN